MTTFTIHIPDDKAEFVKKLLQELNIKIEHDEDPVSYVPNEETVRAKNELKGLAKVKYLRAQMNYLQVSSSYKTRLAPYMEGR